VSKLCGIYLANAHRTALLAQARLQLDSQPRPDPSIANPHGRNQRGPKKDADLSPFWPLFLCLQTASEPRRNGSSLFAGRRLKPNRAFIVLCSAVLITWPNRLQRTTEFPSLSRGASAICCQTRSVGRSWTETRLHRDVSTEIPVLPLHFNRGRATSCFQLVVSI
jgi:hypothetical protein